jgi:hypothetical protein
LYGLHRTGGSNPPLSARFFLQSKAVDFCFVFDNVGS